MSIPCGCPLVGTFSNKDVHILWVFPYSHSNDLSPDPLSQIFQTSYVLISKPSQSSLPPSPCVFSRLTTSLSTQSRWTGSPPESHLLGEGPLTPVFWCHLLEQPMFLSWPHTEPAQPWTKLSLLYLPPRNPLSHAAIGYGAWVRARHRAAMADDPGVWAICSGSLLVPSVLCMPDLGVPLPAYSELLLGPLDLKKHRLPPVLTAGW